MLHFIIQQLDLVRSLLSHLLIQQRKLLIWCNTVPILERSIDNPWMNDLIPWAECKSQKVRKWFAGYSKEISLKFTDFCSECCGKARGVSGNKLEGVR